MPASFVVVSTYERPENLGRCPEAFRRRTATDFELVAADDGSGAATADGCPNGLSKADAPPASA